MRQYLARLCGKIFVAFYNLTAILDTVHAVGLFESMFRDMLAAAAKAERVRKEEEKQARYREAMKDKIRTPGR